MMIECIHEFTSGSGNKMVIRVSGLLGQGYQSNCVTKLAHTDQLIMSAFVIHTPSLQGLVCAWYILKGKSALIFIAIERGPLDVTTMIFMAFCSFSFYKSFDTVYCMTCRGALLERSGLS